MTKVGIAFACGPDANHVPRSSEEAESGEPRSANIPTIQTHMKLPGMQKITGLAAAMTLATLPAFGAVDINEHISLGGYVVGSATYSDVDAPETDTNSTMDLDAVKLITSVKYAPVSGTISLWSGADADPVFLDAFFSYDLGGGTSVTAGKFLSWLGYEAFDPINMATYTYAWQSVPGELGTIGIPAYHSGVKLENNTESTSLGIAILDSNNYMTPVYKGDGDLDNGVGFEAYWTYRTGGLTSFLGGAYDGGGDADIDTMSIDWWVQYVMGSTTFAGEVCFATRDSDTLADVDDFFWGLFVKQAFSEKTSVMFRIAGGSVDDGTDEASYTKFTVAPNYVLTSNLDIIGELSYVSYDDYGADSALFGAVQGRFKF